MGKGRKLGHVADALGKGDGGGPASKQARKPQPVALSMVEWALTLEEGREAGGAGR